MKQLDYEFMKKATIYYCNFKNYTGDDWDGDVLRLFSKNATYSHLFAKIELRQGCRDENGFYPNYLYIVVDGEDCQFNVDEMLEAYGFGFRKRRAKVIKVFTDYNDDIDDILIEEC